MAIKRHSPILDFYNAYRQKDERIILTGKFDMILTVHRS